MFSKHGLVHYTTLHVPYQWMLVLHSLTSLHSLSVTRIATANCGRCIHHHTCSRPCPLPPPWPILNPRSHSLQPPLLLLRLHPLPLSTPSGGTAFRKCANSVCGYASKKLHAISMHYSSIIFKPSRFWALKISFSLSAGVPSSYFTHASLSSKYWRNNFHPLLVI